MSSIDDLETNLCRRMEEVTSGKQPDNASTTAYDETETISVSKSIMREVNWNPIEADPTSAHFKKFIIDLDNVIIYNSGWEWTQLFTKTIIPHGSIISLQFKIIKSAYNAIALGISDRANIGEKTSLSLRNSIAYWGDR